MRGLMHAAVLGLLLAGPGTVAARMADLEVYDRTDGRFLAIHDYRGQRYVAGEPGHEYELRLRNGSGGRVLAVTSVDGVNVITGQTAATLQSGYVLGPYETLSVEGWRKSMDEVAAFYFTRQHNSYAARTGRPFDVGVIGVALFREKIFQPPAGTGGGRCCDGFDRDDEGAAKSKSRDHAAGAPEPSARGDAQGRLEEKLGTGHGRREHSSATYTEFVRASDTPDEILAICYDSRANLVAQGVIPRDREYSWRSPRPFPGGFVPDP